MSLNDLLPLITSEALNEKLFESIDSYVPRKIAVIHSNISGMFIAHEEKNEEEGKNKLAGTYYHSLHLLNYLGIGKGVVHPLFLENMNDFVQIINSLHYQTAFAYDLFMTGDNDVFKQEILRLAYGIESIAKDQYVDLDERVRERIGNRMLRVVQ